MKKTILIERKRLNDYKKLGSWAETDLKAQANLFEPTLADFDVRILLCNKHLLNYNSNNIAKMQFNRILFPSP